MDLIKNKRGWYLSGAAFLMLLIVLIYTLAVINADQREHLSDFRNIGARSLDLIDVYATSQLNLTYYDSLGRIVFPKSLNRLGLDGGFYENNECGNFAGNKIWISNEKKCKPDYLNSLQEHFNDVMNIYDKQNHLLSYLGDGVFVASGIEPNVIRKNNITQSFRSNFKFSSGYDFNIYETAFDNAKEIADVCENEDDFSFCVNEKLAHYSRLDNNFEWKNNCKTNEERIFSSFIKQIEKCLNSVGDNCYCEIDLKNFEGYVENIEMEIKLESNGNVSYNNLYHDFEIDLSKYGSIDSYFSSEEIYLLLKFEEGHLTDLGISDQQIEPVFTSTHKNPNLFMYKSYQDVYSGNENFVLITDYENLRECRTFTRYATICIENNNEFLIYDFHKKNLEERNIPLQFSIYIPDNIAPDPMDFKVKNNPDKSKSLLLFFNRSEAYDISHYNVYVEEQYFSSLNNIEPKFVFEDFHLNEIKQIKNLIVEENNVNYFITITPVDAFGNENKEIDVVQGISEDDGPVPSIDQGSVNVVIDEEADSNFEFNQGFPSQPIQGGNQ